MEYLTSTSSRWDAVWFTDPEQLLPLILTRLTPSGRLVFSQAPAVPGLLRRLTGQAVTAARAAGASWAEIGTVLGISRQAAHERFSGAARGKQES